MYPERPASWFISFCLVLLLAYGAMATYPLTCDGLVCTVKTEKALYTIDRHGARLQILNDLGLVVPGSTTLGLGISHLVERMKNVTDAAAETFKCIVPDSPSLNVTSKGLAAGLLMNYLEINSLEAALVPSLNDPVPGVLTIRYTYSLEGSVVVEQAFSISDRDTSYALSNDTRFTGGTPLTAQYKKGGLKLTASIPNMSWSAPDSGAYYNSSFLTLYANVTALYNDNDLVNITDGDESTTTAVNAELGYAVEYTFQNVFIIDDIPIAISSSINDPTYFTGLTGASMKASFGEQFYYDVTVCKEAAVINNTLQARWTSLLYDPSITVLYSPVTAPQACPGTPPSSAFTCVGGVWEAINVNTTTLVLPPNVGTVVIIGNLTSSSVVINGIASNINVTGCVLDNLTLVHIDLDKDDTDVVGSKVYTLISALNGSCQSNLDSIAVTASIKNGGCQKVSVKKITSNNGSILSGLFTIDKSSCNRWWIILVSVICGVILLALIAVVLMAIFWPAFRLKLRPFSKLDRNRHAAA